MAAFDWVTIVWRRIAGSSDTLLGDAAGVVPAIELAISLHVSVRVPSVLFRHDILRPLKGSTCNAAAAHRLAGG